MYRQLTEKRFSFKNRQTFLTSYNSQDPVKVLFSLPDLTFWTISNNNNNGRKDREDSRVVNFILQILCQTPKQFYDH